MYLTMPHPIHIPTWILLAGHGARQKQPALGRAHSRKPAGRERDGSAGARPVREEGAGMKRGACLAAQQSECGEPAIDWRRLRQEAFTPPFLR
jgi:hypothetical protein